MAEQYGAISKLPPVLQIQVQRVQFDPTTKRSFKSTHHLGLKETIYLDRYMDSQQPQFLDRRQQCWQWKNSLRELEVRRAELLRQVVGCDRIVRCEPRHLILILGFRRHGYGGITQQR